MPDTGVGKFKRQRNVIVSQLWYTASVVKFGGGTVEFCALCCCWMKTAREEAVTAPGCDMNSAREEGLG